MQHQKITQEKSIKPTNLWTPLTGLWSYKLERTRVLRLYTPCSWYQITIGFIHYNHICHFHDAFLDTYTNRQSMSFYLASQWDTELESGQSIQTSVKVAPPIECGGEY